MKLFLLNLFTGLSLFSVAAHADVVQVDGLKARQLYQVMSDINLTRMSESMSATDVNCTTPVTLGMGSFRSCTLNDANANGEKLKIYNALAEEMTQLLVSVTGGKTATSLTCSVSDVVSSGYSCEVVTE